MLLSQIFTLPVVPDVQSNATRIPRHAIEFATFAQHGFSDRVRMRIFNVANVKTISRRPK
jgi:hypothetical protein